MLLRTLYLLALLLGLLYGLQAQTLPVRTAGGAGHHLHRLDSLLLAQRYPKIKAVVVLQQGKIVSEAYYNGGKQNDLHDVRSVSKTLVSALMGMAIADGHIASDSLPISKWYHLRQYDNYDPRKEAIQLRHLLTMTSGFDGFDFDEKSIGNEENMYPQKDWITWALNLPMAPAATAGSQWRYFTAGVVLLGDILDKSIPGGLEQYAQHKLFGPLGIQHYQWKRRPDGKPNTGGGFAMRALDWTRFGQLYLDAGRWQGQQLLSKDWVRHSTQAHCTTVLPTDRYGYLWWLRQYEVSGRPYNVMYCSGNGGNKVYVIPALQAVVVITAAAYNTPYMHKQADDMLTRYILPALQAREP